MHLLWESLNTCQSKNYSLILLGKCSGIEVEITRSMLPKKEKKGRKTNWGHLTQSGKLHLKWQLDLIIIDHKRLRRTVNLVQFFRKRSTKYFYGEEK